MINNILKCCDNLEFLNITESNQINMIYSDILYGTGRDFGDYQDLMADKSIIENHYLPRFIEFHRVLKKDGKIRKTDDKSKNWAYISSQKKRKLFERNYRYLQTRYEKGCKSRNNLIYTLYCGAYGTNGVFNLN